MPISFTVTYRPDLGWDFVDTSHRCIFRIRPQNSDGGFFVYDDRTKPGRYIPAVFPNLSSATSFITAHLMEETK